MKALLSFYLVVRRDPLLCICAIFLLTLVLLAAWGVEHTG